MILIHTAYLINLSVLAKRILLLAQFLPVLFINFLYSHALDPILKRKIWNLKPRLCQLKSALVLLGVTLTISNINAQQIENLVFRQEGVNIIITYDLIGDTEKIYFITVFGSHDNFTTPIELITGEVGTEISPGTGKRITWDAKRELGEFKGNLRIRIHAKLTPIIEFENVSSRFRRGKSHEIQWKTGTRKDNIQFELYKGNELINDLGQIANTGNWHWAIPKNQKT